MEGFQSVTANKYPPLFNPRPPWWGGDLQTLRNTLLAKRPEIPGISERAYLPLNDGSGDKLAARLEVPLNPADEPLVVLVHGLTGCEDSAYIRASAAFHLKRNRHVLRLNLRGAGPSRRVSGGHYHAGCAADIRDVLASLEGSLTAQGIVLIGYSLGGNILINLMADRAKANELPIRGLATVSAPIMPAQAARRLMTKRNTVYHSWLLSRMKKESTAQGARLSEAERRAIRGARTIRDYDDKFIAPRNGFAGADDYYARTAGAPLVPRIPVPTLMIHARDDPWIPATPYEVLQKHRLPHIRIILTPGGGHVGFHATGHIETWHDRCVDVFLGSL